MKGVGMRILSIAAEVAPFSKSGGLGDVGAALPRALAARGHHVVTVSPAYRGAADAQGHWSLRGEYWFWLFGQQHQARYLVWEESDRLAHVLIENPMFDRGGLYHDHQGVFGDNQVRYALMSRAALEVPRVVSLWGAPWGDVDILHAHDWHAALTPLFHKALYKPMGLYPGARSVLTIHNAAHQGVFSMETLGGLDLSPRHADTVAFGGALNSLKAGVQCADMVTAVSPTFAAELQTADGGFGLDEIFRQAQSAGRLRGILNGIDVEAWDPDRDPHLTSTFSAERLQGKAESKAALQAEFGLPQRADVPLFGLVSRLDWQKGIDILLAASQMILQRDVQFVLLGLGDPALHEGLRHVQRAWPERFGLRLAKDFPLAHRIFAGADFSVIPSLFEPCGLTQMYGMRYGAVPVVRATGGLRDSVHPWDPHSGHGTGWLFRDYDPVALAEVIGWAAHTYHEYPDAYRRVQANAMAVDWSWDRAAQAFESLYEGL